VMSDTTPCGGRPDSLVMNRDASYAFWEGDN
jgi:hypothetical protein